MTNKPRFVGERVSFTDVFSEVSREVKKFKRNQYMEYGAHPIVDQGQELIAGYSDEETGLFNDVPAIVFGDHTRCVKYVEEPFFAGADGVKILKPRLSDNARFWWHELKATPIENLGYSRHFKLLKAATFKTYDTASQTEIVVRLDSILDQIAQANQQIDQLDQLVKSRFVEMFGDGDAYPQLAIGEKLKTSSGGTPSSKRKSDYYDGGTIPWLTSGEVFQDCISKTKNYITQLGYDNSSAKWTPANSVVIAMYGATAGKSGLLAIRATTNQAVCSIWPNDYFVPEYLLHAIRQKEQWMIDQTAGGAQPNISQAIIKKMTIAQPPIKMQQEFLSFVQQVDKLKFIAQQQIEKLQELYDSLAQEYFGA